MWEVIDRLRALGLSPSGWIEGAVDEVDLGLMLIVPRPDPSHRSTYPQWLAAVETLVTPGVFAAVEFWADAERMGFIYPRMFPDAISRRRTAALAIWRDKLDMLGRDGACDSR